jgi:hypothetical protein
LLPRPIITITTLTPALTALGRQGIQVMDKA